MDGANVKKETVISMYDEQLQWWINGIPYRTYRGGVSCPNVGREAHRYLHHIISRWDDLAEMTLFTQGYPFDHLPHGVRLEHLFDERYDMVVPRTVKLHEWDAAGRLRFQEPWRSKMADGRMAPARLSLLEWFREYLDVDPMQALFLEYVPGAIFAVKREAIQSRSLDFYKRLIDCVEHHSDPEEAHYLERAWLYIFRPASMHKLWEDDTV